MPMSVMRPGESTRHAPSIATTLSAVRLLSARGRHEKRQWSLQALPNQGNDTPRVSADVNGGHLRNDDEVEKAAALRSLVLSRWSRRSATSGRSDHADWLALFGPQFEPVELSWGWGRQIHLRCAGSLNYFSQRPAATLSYQTSGTSLLLCSRAFCTSIRPFSPHRRPSIAVVPAHQAYFRFPNRRRSNNAQHVAHRYAEYGQTPHARHGWE